MRFKRISIPSGVHLAALLLVPLLPALAQSSLLFFLARPSLSVQATTEAQRESSSAGYSLNDVRFELLASLDLLVRAEKVVQLETGRYSAALGRVPDVIGPMTSFYAIEIVRATRSRFLVTVEGSPETTNWAPLEIAQEISRDILSIDEHYEVRANFPLPAPPAGYLRALAHSVMNRIQSASATRVPDPAIIREMEGVFHGHFTYEIRARSSGGSSLVAIPQTVAARAATGGRELMANQSSQDLFAWSEAFRAQAFGDESTKQRLRQIYLAQKIRQAHGAGYASTVEELTSVWQGLVALRSTLSNNQLDSLELDSTFGYQAEIALLGDGEQIRNLWSINGYGQTTRVNPVEQLMGRFERARRSLDPNRRISSEVEYERIKENGSEAK